MIASNGTPIIPVEPQIPIVERGYLWCSCDTRIPERKIPERCPNCQRETTELLVEAAYNAKVMAFIASKPIDYSCPRIRETKTEWWARMAARYEAAAT